MEWELEGLKGPCWRLCATGGWKGAGDTFPAAVAPWGHWTVQTGRREASWYSSAILGFVNLITLLLLNLKAKKKEKRERMTFDPSGFQHEGGSGSPRKHLWHEDSWGWGCTFLIAWNTCRHQVVHAIYGWTLHPLLRDAPPTLRIYFSG